MVKNPVRKTTLEVIENSKDVKINFNKIKILAKKWTCPELVEGAKAKLNIPKWPSEMHYKGKTGEQTLSYLILLDALNFCFWLALSPLAVSLSNPSKGSSQNKRWEIKYRGKKYNGYFALSLTLREFFIKNPDKVDFNYLKNISFEEFKKILRGGKNLQFLKKRWQITRKISAYISKRYGSAKNFILSANHKLSVLVPRIANELYSFKDEAVWQSSPLTHSINSGQAGSGQKKVFFWKRAQILAIDILGTFNNKGIGYFKDPDYATAFADYKVPQILHTLGIIEYSPRLTRIIANKRLIRAFSREEIEIRSATIWAVEYLQKELKKQGKKLYPFQIDWLLWNKSQSFDGFDKLTASKLRTSNKKMALPYHLTKTFYY